MLIYSARIVALKLAGVSYILQKLGKIFPAEYLLPDVSCDPGGGGAMHKHP